MKKQIRTSIIVASILAVSLAFAAKEDSKMVTVEKIKLPQPVTKGATSLEETIARRRSQRSFKKKELNLGQISQLLWAGQGITERKAGHSLRAAPSAGALYPMEIYALTKNGLYHYVPEENALEVINKINLCADLADAALGQTSVSEAPLNIVISAIFVKVTDKYGELGKRYIDIEAGHIAQNIHLQAVALGLGSVPIGAFNEDIVKSILNFPREQVPLYIIPVGYAKDSNE